MQRVSVDVDGVPASYLTAGEGQPVLMLHGTYWSRVFAPLIDLLAAEGLRPVAVDLKGCGCSGGRLDLHTATVPALTAWVERFVESAGLGWPLYVVGHDIGGAIAQHLASAGRERVNRLALINSVSYDSWPVPGVGRFRDPDVVAATTTEELVALRQSALEVAIGRPMEQTERDEYLSPWHDRRVAESWMALAGAADSRYTQEVMRPLVAAAIPTLLVWGELDTFQPVSYAQRLARDLPDARLVPVAGAHHIPMENQPELVASALADFAQA